MAPLILQVGLKRLREGGPCIRSQAGQFFPLLYPTTSSLGCSHLGTEASGKEGVTLWSLGQGPRKPLLA
jgi:hypothetical protein